jgi:hypothetical protein
MMKTLWTFLNSSFGLWLLTAIFVTGIGSLYTKFQGDVAAQRADSERAAKEDIEISYRYSQLLVFLADLRSSLRRTDTDESQQRIKETLWSAMQAGPGIYNGVYSEFDKYSLLSLEVDFRRTLHSIGYAGNDLDALDKSISHIASLSTENQTDPAKAAASILRAILPRWKNTGFPYVSCSEESPFCSQ